MSDKKTMKHTVSCGAVAYREFQGSPQILLVRPWPDRDVWGIPKGHVDPGETFEETARRETYEEAGIVVELEEPLPECMVEHKGEHKRVLTWMARQVGNEHPKSMDPDGEIVDVRFFDVDKLPRLHVYQKSVIEHAATLAKKKVESAFCPVNELGDR